MIREELAMWNVGTNLDQLMNLDPRGYGVCRILYEGSRAYAGEPVSMHSAKALTKLLNPGDIVYIMTGFILRPHKCPETDGIVGAILLARALIKAFDVKLMRENRFPCTVQKHLRSFYVPEILFIL